MTTDFYFSTIKDGPMNLVGHPAFDVERANNRSVFLACAPQAVFPKLVHGSAAAAVGASNDGLDISSLTADALVTDRKGLALTVTMADCPPVLLEDPISGVIAIAHCGWRGLADGILENTIGLMKSSFNCDPSNIFVVVGPGICPSCYAVGPEVASRFGITGQNRTNLYLYGIIKDKLEKQGIKNEDIADFNECSAHTTVNGKPKFYSRRRQREDPPNNNMAVFIIR